MEKKTLEIWNSVSLPKFGFHLCSANLIKTLCLLIFATTIISYTCEYLFNKKEVWFAQALRILSFSDLFTLPLSIYLSLPLSFISFFLLLLLLHSASSFLYLLLILPLLFISHPRLSIPSRNICIRIFPFVLFRLLLIT